MAPAAGVVSPTVGSVASFDTVTVRCEVAVLPAASRANAVMVCDPLGTLPDGQLTEYGALVSSAPRLPPSILNCTPTTPTLSEAFAAIATDPDTVAPAAGVVSPTVGSVVSPGGGGGDVVFDTVTVRCEVAVLPAASRANAVMVCDPLGTLPDGQLTEYGALVSSAPRLPPSILNCTPTTPTLSEAFAAIATDPDTVAPAAGVVSPTVGSVVSPGGGGGDVVFDTVTVRCEVAVLPAASRANAVMVCDPLGTLPDGQLTEYGALVSSAPRLPPSILNCTPTTPTLSEAFAAIATDPDTVAPAAGVVSPTVGSVVSPGGGGGDVVFDTVTVRCEVAVLPAASRANAVMVCDPLGTLPDGQLTEYGALVSSAPISAPSTWNCTPTTPTLSDASAAALTDPETVAPAAGLVSATDGAAVSAGGGGGVVALETSTRCSRTEDFPVASTAVTLRTCVPFEALVVSHLVS